MARSEGESLPLSVRLIIIFGIIWSVIAFVFLPFTMIAAFGREWSPLLHLCWLLLPIIVLLTSLKYWYTQKRAGAVADAIVACGISFVWLLVVAIQFIGGELGLGLLPYVVVVAFLIFTALSFWSFVHSLPERDRWAGSAMSGWGYWSLFVSTVIFLIITSGLIFYFQVFAA
mgnify:FL=1